MRLCLATRLLYSRQSGAYNKLNTKQEYQEHRNYRLYGSSGGGSEYAQVHKRSIENGEEFWAEAAQGITWFKKYDKVLENGNYPTSKWFVGGELNMCYNALDRHVEAGKGDKVALIYDSPITNVVNKFTYSQLQDQTARLASLLVGLGVGKGDRVLIYMPMIAEAVVGMLATVRIGATHSVVFGGFAAKELGSRIGHARPKVILTANCGLEPNRTIAYKPIVDEAIELSGVGEEVKVVVYHREGYQRAELKRGRDQDWADGMSSVVKGHDCVPVPSHHPLYILYTSGTTGEPKGVVRGTGGHAVVLNWSLFSIFGMRGGEEGGVWWAASDLGWVVGHSYICYAPLLAGLTTILYEGKPVGTPDAKQFFRVIDEHKVCGMFTAPTALRAIRRVDPQSQQSQQYSLKSLKYIFVAGEHCDMESRNWAQKAFKVPVLDNWWQTETGHPIAASCVGLGSSTDPPQHSCGHPLPGYQLKILREDGSEADVGEMGRIVCKLPMPPGFMDTLFQNNELYHSAYFKQFHGYYDSMDAGYIDAEGYVYVMAREDDVINVAGHRLSTSAIEEAILEHKDVADAAVVGVPDQLKGQLPLALYVIKPGCVKSEEEMNRELVAHVRKVMGPIAAFKLAAAIPALPRTRSGKTPRKSIADLAQNKSVKIPPTIEDASVYKDILAALQKLGFGKTADFK